MSHCINCWEKGNKYKFKKVALFEVAISSQPEYLGGLESFIGQTNRLKKGNDKNAKKLEEYLIKCKCSSGAFLFSQRI